MDIENDALQAFLAKMLANTEAAGGSKQAGSGFDFLEASPLARLSWVMEESVAVEEAIDALLERDDWQARRLVIDALARAEVGWAHPTIIEALGREDIRMGAALVAARGMPEELDLWLERCEVVDEALEVMRAVAMAGDVGRAADWPGFLGWHEAIMELEQAEAEKRLAAGALATLDANFWARRTLAGESDEGWVGDRERVADFLAMHSLSVWTTIFGGLHMVPGTILSGELKAKMPAARAFAGLLAVAAAIGLGEVEELSETAARELLAFFELSPQTPAEQWEGRVGRAGLAGCLALLGGELELAGEEGLGLLLAQVAAHERLLAHDYHSPGIPGLPFSASDPEDIDPAAGEAIRAQLAAYFDATTSQAAPPASAEEVAGQGLPAAIVVVLRSIGDLCRLTTIQPQNFGPILEAWRNSFDTLLGSSDIWVKIWPQLGSNGHEPIDPNSALKLAAHSGPAALIAAQILVDRAGEEDMLALARLWSEGKLAYAGLFRQCVLSI